MTLLKTLLDSRQQVNCMRRVFITTAKAAASQAVGRYQSRQGSKQKIMR
jgi:hypothetical protein